MGRALDENWPIRVSSMSTLRRKANIGRPYMSQLILMIGRIDDLDNPEALTEVWRRAMPVVELSRMQPEHYLNGLENDVMEVGWEAMRPLLVEQWRLSDELLVRRFRQEHAGAMVGDGYDRLKVASRLGVVHLPRQVCYLPGADRHHLPGNAGLPEHEGQVTTRGLQDCHQSCRLARLNVCWGGWPMIRRSCRKRSRGVGCVGTVKSSGRRSGLKWRCKNGPT